MKEKILLYGLGNFFSQYEKEINEKYDIAAFIDKQKTGEYSGKQIIHIDGEGHWDYKYIIVMLYDIQECLRVSRTLISMGVDCKKILLGHSLYGEFSECFESISVLSDGNILLARGGLHLKVRSKDEFNNVYEVLIASCYDYYLNNDKKDIVLDVGMNIGGASAFFISRKRTQKVFGYEPFEETFAAAKDNLKEYLSNPEKIEIFHYGISGENSEQLIGFNADMTCGQSTIESTREHAYERYEAMGLVDAENEKKEVVYVRKASEVFKPIMEEYSDCNIVLKLDCEGEEYGILENLYEERILNKFTFIMLEWHYKGKKELLSYLEQAGFSYWCGEESDHIGMIYAYQCRC